MSTEPEAALITRAQRPLPDSAESLRLRLHAHLPALRQRYGVRALWLFGSRVRAEERSDSDLDVLIELDERPLSLLKFIELENHLSDLLAVRVDLVEKKTLKPALGRHILHEAVPV
jgi:uncharacterized protein